MNALKRINAGRAGLWGLALALLALCLAVSAWAAGSAVYQETITPGNTATGFASNLNPSTGTFAHQYASAALITVEGNSMRFCMDGTVPTQGSSGVCHTMAAGQSYYIRGGANVRNFRCIDYTSGQASTVRATIFFGGE